MKLKVLSYDCEMLPYFDQMPLVEECPILMMTLSANYGLFKEFKKVALVLSRDNHSEVKIDGDKVIAYFADERNMIDKWTDLVRGADIIVGYNTNGFDFPYIIDRSKLLKIHHNQKLGLSDDVVWYKKRVSKGMSVARVGGIKGKVVFDVLHLLRRGDESNVFKKGYNLKNLTLAWVSKEVFGESDVGMKLEFGPQRILEYWKTGKDEKEFIEYGIKDAELALEFVLRFRLLDRFIMLSRKSGKLIQDIVDSVGFGALVENLLAKEFSAEGRVIPVRIGGESEGEDLEGAYVHEPKLGITDNLGSCDYSGMYPTIMIKHNLCYTTVIDGSISMDELGLTENDIEEITSEEGIPYGKFVKKEVRVGIIPHILKGLREERAKLKILMKKCEKGSALYIRYDGDQNAAKILMNSFYGYTGDKKAKLYSWAVASAVTGSGRKQIKKTIGMVEGSSVKFDEVEYKLRVAIADTDSVYIQVIPTGLLEIKMNRDIVVGCVNDVVVRVNATLEKPMELSFENYIKRLLVTAKKRYTMLVEDDKGRRNIINKGIESVRRDWCDYSSDCMDNVIEIILNEEDIAKGINESVKFIQNEANRLRKGEVNIEKLIMSKKFSKPLTWYDGKAVHAMVVKKMLSRGKKVEIGDRVSYFVMNNGKKLISEKAEDVEYVIKERMVKDIDKEYYIYKQLLAPVGRVMEVLGVRGIDVETKRQKSLMDF